MNKRMILLATLLVIVATGCSTWVQPEEIEACETICSGNKGIKYIRNSGCGWFDECICNNGVSIYMTNSVVKDNTKKEAVE